MNPRHHRGLVVMVVIFAALAGLGGLGAGVLSSCAGLGSAAEEPALGEPVIGVPDMPGGPDKPGGASGESGDAAAAKAAGTRDAEAKAAVAKEAPPGLPAERGGGGEAAVRTARSAPPAESGLKAGFADDNRQFNYFTSFLERYGSEVPHYPIPVQERIVFRVRDSRGRSVPNAAVEIFGARGDRLTAGVTHADGGFMFFPGQHGGDQGYRLRISYNQMVRQTEFERSGRREIEVALPGPRAEMANVPLDLLFILDTTGSMGEEIERLKATIEIINLNLSALSSRPRVRFGMVLYKDRGDEYVTRTVPFTEDLESFRQALAAVSADGGGDTPEDLQAALEESMSLDWNRSGVRLGFIITDAPTHLDYGQEYTYVQAAQQAKEKGIKIFSVGTGGLDLAGEYVLRQISQYTAGKYIFLTYGETGESEGGAPGSVSHHTGANYQTDKLEAIIIRFAREELAHLSDQPLDQGEEYFEANKVPEEANEDTLATLFSLAVSQLVDYSSVRISAGTAAAVLPVSPAQEGLGLTAEYFTEQLVLSFGRDGGARETFRLVERKDLQRILEELELQLSDLSEVSGEASGAARVGELLGAEVLIAGKLYAKADGFELFLKLLRVETGEVLSVTKAVIDRRLGLEA